MQETRTIYRGDSNRNPADIGFWSLVAEDFDTHDRLFFAQGFWAVFWHRFVNQRMGVRWRFLRMPISAIYQVMYKLSQWVCGIDLPYTVELGRRVKLEHFGGMVLVAERIGDDVVIRQNTTIGITGPENPYGRPVIEDGVQIGAGSVIIGPITVGAGAVIGANAVVVSNVLPGARMGGVPARPLRSTKAGIVHHG